MNPKRVWSGSEALAAFLVPISELAPSKGNPRRGDVAALRASLRRFGQVRPITTHDGRIVAGHHVVLAAQEEGWTHVAAISHDFATAEEAHDFLLADNRLHDLGGYEDDLLLAQLKAASDLEGTGYSREYVDELDRRLSEQFGASADEPQPRLDERVTAPPPAFQVPLYPKTALERQDFALHVSMLKHEWGLKDTTETVLRAVREAALAANS